MLPAEFWQGVKAFNQKQFYVCHDQLEALWMESAEDNRNFYQGILQIAVAGYHLKNDNWQGTVTLLGEGIRRLHPYQPSWEDIDITRLISESHQLLIELQQCGVEGLGTIKARDFPKIHQIVHSHSSTML